MGGCLKGCLGRIVTLVALVVAAGVAWWYAPPDWRERVDRLRAQVVEFADDVVDGREEDRAADAEVSRELADATLDRVERFRADAAPDDELVLGSGEVSSVVRHSFPGMLPEGLTDPSVAMRGGRLLLSARVALAAFPEVPSLEEAAGLLPDTVPIRMGGSLGPRNGSTVTLYVEEVQAARIPLPDRFIPEILEALGREDRDGLPPNAMPVPLPQGLRAAWVRRDSLVLVAGG